MSSWLDIKESLQLSRWVPAPADNDLIDRIARQNGVPEIVARLLAARGVAPDSVDSFLHPRLARDFPDPFSLAGMKDAAAWFADAISSGRRIGLFGDFDVDGATSTSIMARFLRHCGIDAPFYIPDRLKEGYGPNTGALANLKERGIDTVVMMDCGITAHDVIAQGQGMGLDIIVLDHHEAEEKLPPATHVINPKRKDDTSDLKMLAACGVTFLFCVAVNRMLRENGWYSKTGRAEAPLRDWLDIVALGTVCDMVPLTGANRLFVRFGLDRMAKMENPGIRALADVAKFNSAPTPYHMGFVFGPRINAGSRVHKSDLGARLLSTDDAEEAKNIAWTLNDCNEKRKELQAQMFDHAVSMVENKNLHNHPVIVVGHEDWHPGLSGLVAGRLKEKYDRPAVVVTYAMGLSGVLEGRGSGRSVPGVNMGAAFIDARNEGILVKGGGHAMAAGFTVMPDRLDAFTEYLNDHVAKQSAGQTALSETVIDGTLSVRGAQADFVRLIQNHLGPFGQENGEPLFVLPSVRVHMVDIVGTDHIKCVISDWDGGGRIKAVAFRAKDTPMGQALLKQSRDTMFHLAGRLQINSWQGRETVELHIEDAAFAVGQAQKQSA